MLMSTFNVILCLSNNKLTIVCAKINLIHSRFPITKFPVTKPLFNNPSGVPVLEQCRSNIGSRHSSVGTTSVSDTGSVSDECRNVRPIRYWIPTSFRHRIPTSFRYWIPTSFRYWIPTSFRYWIPISFRYWIPISF